MTGVQTVSEEGKAGMIGQAQGLHAEERCSHVEAIGSSCV